VGLSVDGWVKPGGSNSRQDWLVLASFAAPVCKQIVHIRYVNPSWVTIQFPIFDRLNFSIFCPRPVVVNNKAKVASIVCVGGRLCGFDNVHFCSFYYWFVRRRFAFDGGDNTKPLGLCNRKIKIFFVIEKILLNFY